MRTTSLINGNPRIPLYITQALGAFADNMILFIVISILKRDALPDYYLGVVQAAFLLAYVLLAPFVGTFADKHAKRTALFTGNALKLLGAAALLAGWDPALSYAVIGCGAAVYSPGKYGILTLPFMTKNEEELLKANGKVEGFTIISILLGSVAGGMLASQSIPLSIIVCLLFYTISFLMTFLIPANPGDKSLQYKKDAFRFLRDIATLFQHRTTRFSLVGTGSFWMSSSVIRLAVVAWVPLHLGISNVDQISLIVAVTAVGIMLGALLAPKLVPAGKATQSYVYGVVMTALLLLLPAVSSLPVTIVLLLLIGACGGAFVVPMNTLLQHTSKELVGPGKTIAIQNLVENVLMLGGVALYTKATESGVSVDVSIIGVAAVLALLILYLYFIQRKMKG
jgi:MFS transporter, LPLT family, lysophospholipid transporter